MKKGIKKAISTIAILTMTFQIGMPMVPGLTSKAFATNTTIPVATEKSQAIVGGEAVTELSESVDATQTEEISKNYEIKDEETWDVSANGDGSVIAKWTLENRTLTISGTGEMKNWTSSSEEDWHNIQYENILENVIIEEGVTTIGYHAFSYLDNLNSINIANTVKIIGSSAFLGCGSLSKISIPDSVTLIEENAFQSCRGIKEIYIGSGAIYNTSSETRFYGCNNLEKITVSENNPNFSSQDGILFNKSKTEILKYPANKSGDTYTIPNTVTTIHEECFRENKNIKEIKLPNNLNTIETAGFYECDNLTNINFPSSLKEIGFASFSQCATLESVILPEGITTIGRSAFEGCKSVKSLYIPSTVTEIGENAFSSCSHIYFINLDNETKELDVPDLLKRVLTLGDVFYSEEIYFHDSKLSDDKNKIMLEDIEDRNIYVRIQSGALKGVTIGFTSDTWDLSENQDGSVIGKFSEDGTITISGNGKIKEFSSNTDVPWYLFREKIKKVIIQEGVTSIGTYSFYACEKLVSVQIPSSVTEISEKVFTECRNLKDIILDENNKNYQCDNGVLYNINKTKIICYPPAKQDTHYEMPSTIQEISERQFAYCKNLISIVMSDNVTVIGRWTFNGCTNLQSIKLSNKLETIGYGAFERCSNLKTIEMPDTVKTIEDYAFELCSKLETVKFSNNLKEIAHGAFSQCISLDNVFIPSSVEEIGGWTFFVCRSLKTIQIAGDLFTLGSDAFSNCPKELTIYCKKGSLVEQYAIDNEIKYVAIPPTITFETTGNTIPSKKHTCKVTVKDEETGLNTDELKYRWVQGEAEPLENEFSEEFINGSSIEKTTGDGEWYLWILAKDKVENVTISKEGPFVFDNTGAKVEIVYSSKNPTNKNVMVTINADEQIQEITGWTLSSDKKTLTKEYSANTKETVTIKDLAGNETQATIEINNIDKTAPTINVGYSTKNPTRENVTVTITSNEEVQEIEGWNLSSDKKILTKEYSANTKKTITIKDLAENERQVNVEINNIDKIVPSVEVTYSTKEITEENVKVTITANEEVQNIIGWELSSDKKALTKEYNANTKETITVKDIAGNETQVNIEINNIEKKITLGDINQDEKIDVTDFLMLKRHLVAGNRNSWNLTGDSLLAGDMNENGTIDITDMLILKREVLNNL